jgi:DNA-binding NarL/FixJ family response regulator
MNRARILLVDDHAILMEGLQSLLAGMYDLVGKAGDGRAMVEAARELRPDIIISDISMPLLNGLDAARQLKKEGIRAKVIFLTMHDDAALASEAFRLGAAGYVLKESAGSELFLAIKEVLAGRIYISPLITKDMLMVFMEPKDQIRSQTDLTLRKREILQLIAEGKTMKEIAGLLKISIRTVETHKYELMREVSVKTTAELIQFAIKLGLVLIKPLICSTTLDEPQKDTNGTNK